MCVWLLKKKFTSSIEIQSLNNKRKKKITNNLIKQRKKKNGKQIECWHAEFAISVSWPFISKVLVHYGV